MANTVQLCARILPFCPSTGVIQRTIYTTASTNHACCLQNPISFRVINYVALPFFCCLPPLRNQKALCDVKTQEDIDRPLGDTRAGKESFLFIPVKTFLPLMSRERVNIKAEEVDYLAEATIPVCHRYSMSS